MHVWNQFRRKNRRKPGSIHPVSPPKFTNQLSLIFCRSEAWHSMAGVPDHRIPGWKSKCLPGCHHPEAMDKSNFSSFFCYLQNLFLAVVGLGSLYLCCISWIPLSTPRKHWYSLAQIPLHLQAIFLLNLSQASNLQLSSPDFCTQI